MEARYLKEQLEKMLGGVEIFLDFDNLSIDFGAALGDAHCGETEREHFPLEESSCEAAR